MINQTELFVEGNVENVDEIISSDFDGEELCQSWQDDPEKLCLSCPPDACGDYRFTNP